MRRHSVERPLPDAQDLDVRLKKDEAVIGIVRGCAQIGPRRAPGHHQGGSQGFSFWIALGASRRRRSRPRRISKAMELRGLGGASVS